MKVLIWIVAGVLALFWTGFAALSAGLLSWVSEAMASGGVADWGRILAQWPLPAWASWWIDPAAVKSLQELLAWALDGIGSSLPLAGSLIGWLVPLTWLLWGFGLVFLLGLAALGHWLSGRSSIASLKPMLRRLA